MKKRTSLLLLTIFASLAMVYSQVPQALSYQATIRGTDQKLVANREVSMKVCIIQDSIKGDTVYSESHLSTTNANGLLTVKIGEGNNAEKAFSSINWSAGAYFIHTAIDPEGGSDYQLQATSQLLSVPFAFHSQTADSLSGNAASKAEKWDKKLDSLVEGDIKVVGNLDFGVKIAAKTKNEWVNLFPVTRNWCVRTVYARAHDFGYTEKFHEWRVIVGDNSNPFIEEIVNIGNATGNAELRVSEGYVQGRWTGNIGGGPFCRFIINGVNIN